ncbi:putative tellurite resistance protein B-like protein [Thermonema lapsum]|uniref:Putative tellurite resistance protein B-like protein n=1 Tax=Thermonema lapsum TaxID=28195 RepID=A0A846MM91_9BACT|nr:hypothetical protein [Thermonema lapsum]NIK72565.1 putative tellurite resistance protein B-like protein [Thermonema lapsum]
MYPENLTVCMTPEEKEVLLLLEYAIFRYHGFDDNERERLENDAAAMHAQAQLEKVYAFVDDILQKTNQSEVAVFEATLRRIKEVFAQLPEERRLEYVIQVWNANKAKGYVTEIEAIAMLKVAKELGVQRGFVEYVRQKR